MNAIEIKIGVFVPSEALEMSAVRASGPGGQNVNKVSSKVDLRVDLAKIVGLDDASRARLQALAFHRLDASGKLQIISQRTRDQLKNIHDAEDKVRALVLEALVAPRPRKKTKPTRGAIRRRLEDKQHASDKKRSRRERPAD